jgi:hypothetical protein
MKEAPKHVQPAPRVPAFPANDNNTTRMIVSLLETMPLPDRAALGELLIDQDAARMREASLDEILARQPAAVLRALRERHMRDALLRLRELDERDACYCALAELLPQQRSGYARDQAIIKRLTRYKETRWHFDQDRAVPPDDPIRWLMHQILSLDKAPNGTPGVIRSRGTIARAIAGSRSKVARWMDEYRAYIPARADREEMDAPVETDQQPEDARGCRRTGAANRGDEAIGE